MLKSSRHRLTILILLGLVLGIVVGSIVHYNTSEIFYTSFSDKIKLLSTIFLRLVQMVIAPLVLTTLTAGIAKMPNKTVAGRIGGKSILWFITASLVSLLIGLALVNLFQPGAGWNIKSDNLGAAKDIMDKTTSFSLKGFIEHVFPKSVIEAMANNEILQLVVFCIFFGFAIIPFGEKAKPLVNFLDLTGNVILKMVTYIMNFAPIGVFGGVTSIIALHGLGKLTMYGSFFGAFIVGIIVLWIVLLLVGYLILGKRLIPLLRHIINPMTIAFSTTSSEAVFPKLTEELERYGCKPRVVSFVLPLGYSFNLDGSMMYMTFASIFIAQAYNVPLDLGTQLTMLLVLMLTSKGIAGVPRASLVVVVATCAMFKIPAEGIALIIPIDHFCDMLRSMTNVLGNAMATASIDKWEKDE